MTSSMSTTQSNSHNERAYHNTNAAYSLPNDKTEHERLEGQANRLRDLMNGQIFHAPLATPTVRKALDMGCGTGTVSHAIASKFPAAQVYGLDLSPVPNIREKLPNIEYVQGDFTELVGSDPRFEKGSFDYIFSRLLIMGMTDWKGYIERCVELARPGGWVEMHDLDMAIYRVPDPITSSQRKLLDPHSLTLSEVQDKSHPADAWFTPCSWLTTFNKLSAAKGFDPACGRHLPSWFIEAGLEDVQIRRYIYPMSMWEGLTDVEKQFAVHHREGMGSHMPDLIMKLGQGQDVVSQEEVEKASQDSRKENENWESGRGLVWLYVICGRKPMK